MNAQALEAHTGLSRQRAYVAIILEKIGLRVCVECKYRTIGIGSGTSVGVGDTSTHEF